MAFKMMDIDDCGSITFNQLKVIIFGIEGLYIKDFFSDISINLKSQHGNYERVCLYEKENFEKFKALL